ncbi:ankyrin repeat-containing domain protein, partial [Morchella snyderi]
VVKLLILNSGADTGAKISAGWSPLHEAAREGHKGAAELLLRNGANLPAKTLDGWTSLLVVAGDKGREDMVELLLSHGTDPMAIWRRLVRGLENIPLYILYIVKEKRKYIISLLTSHGAQ